MKNAKQTAKKTTKSVLQQVLVIALALGVLAVGLPWISGNQNEFDNRVDDNFGNFVEKF